MKWHYLDPDLVNKNVFGFRDKIFACKVAKWHCKSDVRGFTLKGWRTFAECCEFDPRSGKELKESTWFIFAAIGE
jgi:hypothetical protein